MIFKQIICSGGYGTVEIQHSKKYTDKRDLHSTIDRIKYFYALLLFTLDVLYVPHCRVYPVNFLLYN